MAKTTQTQPAQPAAESSKSTQGSLLITEIKDGVVVLRDGSLRAVVLTSAINFDSNCDQISKNRH